MKRPWREFLDTLGAPLVLACGIPKVLTLSCLAIPIRILSGVKLTERAQRGDANYLGDLWYLDVLRNKIPLLFQPPKLNILPLELVALKSSIWKQTLCDYGIKLGSVPLLCDNESAVKIANNPVQHSRTKHIEIRHHFLRDNVANGNILLRNVRSEDQLADIFTKPLNEGLIRFMPLQMCGNRNMPL